MYKNIWKRFEINNTTIFYRNLNSHYARERKNSILVHCFLKCNGPVHTFPSFSKSIFDVTKPFLEKTRSDFIE